MRIGEWQILKVERTQRSAVPSVRFCAHQLGAELPAGILDTRDRERTGALRFDDGDAIAGDELRQGRHKTLIIRPRDPVTDPDDLRIRRRLKETPYRIEMGLPVRKNGLRHKRAQALQGVAGACQRDLGGLGRGRRNRDDATFAPSSFKARRRADSSARASHARP